MRIFQKIVIILLLFYSVTELMAAPIPASCSPATLNYCCNFGITNITFNTINNPSNDGVDGYSDFTSFSTTVLEGQTYSLSIQTTAPNTSNQNYAGWIDFNNDGVLDDVTERIFTVTSQLNTVVNITIPSGAVLNTDLRLRVAADFNLSAAPTACGDLDRGQAEDYTVVIAPNSNPPVAAFSVPDTIVCNPTVCFTDESLNVPTSWLWYFGDGTTSFQQDPCHTYQADGDYTVSLIATNANGSDSDTLVNYITVNVAGQLTAATCNPTTTTYCCNYGITNVNFANINNSSLDATEGYQDFSCTNNTTVDEGSVYLINITTGITNPQDVSVWIDYNNDGVFNNTNEFVMDEQNSFNPSGNIIIPIGATLNTPIRMRVSADIVGVAQTACDDNHRGQTEDYGIIINESTNINDINSLENSFTLFPNPASTSIYLKHDDNLVINQIAIYNKIGQQIDYFVNIKTSAVKINVGDYEKGVYMMRIITEKEMITKKFIVN